MQEQLRTLALSRTFYMTPSGLSETQALGGTSMVNMISLPAIIDGKYKIISQLGEGGMGTVYRAHHMTLARDVALKTLRAGKLPPDAYDRFTREVQAVAKLDSKNVVRVFDFGLTEGNQPYYTMELLHGESLAEHLESEKKLTVATAIAIFTDVAAGLQAAHAKGIVHRDLKPANIFLTVQNGNIQSAKIVDFGIAKLADDKALSAQQMTQGGAIFGSPLYMSPEQSQGEATDHRTDIYSFGCALYEALTGAPPFVGNTAFETICMHQTARIPKISKRGDEIAAPLWLEGLVSRCLAKDRKDRVQSFQEILDIFSFNQNITERSDNSQFDVGHENDDDHSEADHDHHEHDYPLKPNLKPSWIAVSAVSGVFIAIACCSIYYFCGQTKPAHKGIATTLLNPLPPVDKQIMSTPVPTDEILKAPTTAFDGFMEKDGIPVAAARKLTFAPGDKRVKLRAMTVSAENLEAIGNSGITDLDMQQCIIDNKGMVNIGKAPLTALRLGRTTLTDEGAIPIAKCKKLTHLQMPSTKVTDNAIIQLATLPKVAYFDLRRTGITDRSMPAMAKMPNLLELRMTHTAVTATGVGVLCLSSHSLQRLEIAACPNISLEQLQELRTEFPNILFFDKDRSDKDKDRL